MIEDDITKKSKHGGWKKEDEFCVVLDSSSGFIFRPQLLNFSVSWLGRINRII